MFRGPKAHTLDLELDRLVCCSNSLRASVVYLYM
jgi:hypothetical protein